MSQRDTRVQYAIDGTEPVWVRATIDTRTNQYSLYVDHGDGWVHLFTGPLRRDRFMPLRRLWARLCQRTWELFHREDDTEQWMDDEIASVWGNNERGESAE